MNTFLVKVRMLLSNLIVFWKLASNLFSIVLNLLKF